MGIATQQNAAPLDAVEARRGYVQAHPLGEAKRRIWRFFESELLDWVEKQRNACASGPPDDTIHIAIGAHAKKEIA